MLNGKSTKSVLWKKNNCFVPFRRGNKHMFLRFILFIGKYLIAQHCRHTICIYMEGWTTAFTPFSLLGAFSFCVETFALRSRFTLIWCILWIPPSFFFLFTRPLKFPKCATNAIATFHPFYEFDLWTLANPFS